jgi:hypothetical protein
VVETACRIDDGFRQMARIIGLRRRTQQEAIMFPSQAEIELHAAEARETSSRREMAQRHRQWQYEPAGGQHDLTTPAFASWRTAVQMAFAVAFTLLGLGLVLASIVAITRA